MSIPQQKIPAAETGADIGKQLGSVRIWNFVERGCARSVSRSTLKCCGWSPTQPRPVQIMTLPPVQSRLRLHFL
jgi:hypothetical protein